jgi:hypothetical protein
MIRNSLRHPEHLRTFLEDAVPALAADFDCARARLLDREFPLDDWRLREADLPFEIPYRHGSEELWAVVCVLIEHQSDTDPLLPLRLLYFAVQYWDRQWRDWEKLRAPRPPLRLRPVLPLVLFTATRPWGSNRTLVDLLGEPTAFHPFAPAWQPLFWNLADRNPDALLASGKEWLQVMAVLRAQEGPGETFETVFREALSRLQSLYGRDHVRWYDLLRIVLSWALYRRPLEERDALLAAAQASQAEAQRQQEVRIMGQTIADALIAEGEARGQARGQAEGELRATRRHLRQLLAGKFGPLPESLIQRIESVASLEGLEQALVQVQRLQSVEELQL